MLKIISLINKYLLWGIPMLCLFLIAGVYFTHKTKAVQIRKLFSVFKKSSAIKTKENISPIQALTASLATTLGTGNIIAVASAVILGGAGAVFWMWISAFLGMATAYAETLLAMFYRKKNKNGEYEGSPSLYISKGLNMPKIAILYSILTILCSFGMGNMAQGYAASLSMKQSFNTPEWVTGICIAGFSASIIFGGIKKLGSVTEKLIPVLSILYILGCMAVIIMNISSFPSVIKEIITKAFDFKAVGTGSAIGALQWGIKRGIFSNEAGLGSSAIIHSASSETSPHKQGIWAMLQVFFDTIIMCSLTAFTLLITKQSFNTSDADKAVVIAFSSAFGEYAGAFISISIFFFAIMTIAGWSAIGAKSFSYAFGEKKLNIYKIAYILIAFLGANISGEFIWEISDFFNCSMALINIVSLLMLGKKVENIHKKTSLNNY